MMLFIAARTFAQTELRIVPNDSEVIWTGTKITGSHQGTVRLREGTIQLEDQKLAGGHFVIDMTTITCTDIPDTDPIPKRNLERHLKDADFFDVTRYPTARFEIADVRPHPDKPLHNLVIGDLTIKGVTKRWKIEAQVVTQNEKLFVAHAILKFDRQLFGMAYKGLKDELVHDVVQLEMVVTAR